MSKTTKESIGSDSAKTVIDQAKREVPNFNEHDKKFEQRKTYAIWYIMLIHTCAWISFEN